MTEVERLREAIRKHRDARGHERCWENDLELYAALGEPLPESPELPNRAEFLYRCREYYEGQQGATNARCPNCGCPSPLQFGSVRCVQCGEEFTRKGIIKVGSDERSESQT